MAKAQANPASEMVTMSPSQIVVLMNAARNAGESLMIWGPPGIGKSQVVQQFAQSEYPIRSENEEVLARMRLEVENNVGTTQQEIDKLESKLLDQDTSFIDVRLSQMEPSDLRGIPVPFSYYVDAEGNQVAASDFGKPGVVEKKEVVWAPVALLNLPEDWKGCIMFDELNSAMPIVQAAAYQIFLDRCIGEHKIPDGAFIVAAGNREGDGGVTFTLATPLKDRMMHAEMKASVDDWFAWALNNRVLPDVMTFIKHNPKHFNTLCPRDPSPVGGSSPRSWVSVSNVLKANPHLDQKEHKKVLKAMIAGRVSLGVATEFMTYRSMTSKLPAPGDILDGKVTDVRAENYDMAQSYALGTNLVYAVLDLFEERAKGDVPVATWGKKASNFLEFLDVNFGTNQKELVIMCVKTCLNNRCMFKPKEVPYYIKFAQNHKDLILKARDV